MTYTFAFENDAVSRKDSGKNRNRPYGRNKLLHMNKTLLNFVNFLSVLLIFQRNIVSTGLFCQMKLLDVGEEVPVVDPS